ITFQIVIFYVNTESVIVNLSENPNDRIACHKVYVDSILILYKKSIVEINVNQAFYGCGCERI
ncbi:hypothetical protein EG100_21045, partial [Salmonella enterica]|nr:hypothetical protein [Salmonella enterica]